MVDMETSDCVDQSLACYKACLETKAQCMELGEDHTDAEHLTLLADTASISLLIAEMALRNSSYVDQISEIAADLVEDCADSCESFDEDYMRECAQTCREYAQYLRQEESTDLEVDSEVSETVEDYTDMREGYKAERARMARESS